MNIGELFIELGFKADTMKLKEFMHAVGELNMSSIASAVGLGALYEATNRIMDVATKTGMEMYTFSQMTKLPAQPMEQLKSVIKEVGGNAEAAAPFIKSVRKDISDLLTTGNSEHFQLLWNRIFHLDPRNFQSQYDMMDKMQVKWKSMSESMKLQAQAAGLPSDIALVLEMQGKVSDRMKTFHELSTGQIEDIHKYWKSLSDLWHEVNYTMGSIGATLAPIFQKINELLSYILQNTTAIKIVFFALAGGMVFRGVLAIMISLANATGLFMMTTLRLSVLWDTILLTVGNLMPLLLPLIGWEVGKMIGNIPQVKSALSGEEGLFTNMFKGWDRLTGSTPGATSSSTIHVHVSGVGDPSAVAERVVEEVNKRDRNVNYYGGSRGSH